MVQLNLQFYGRKVNGNHLLSKETLNRLIGFLSEKEISLGL